MINKNALFIEETAPDGYKILWRGQEALDGLKFMVNYKGNFRIEMWSKAHAETDKGFAPLAFREKNQTKIYESNTCKFLLRNLIS